MDDFTRSILNSGKKRQENTPANSGSPSSARPVSGKFEHTVVVLRFEKKGFAVTRKDVLQGLSEESSTELIRLGEEGWELVAVLPFSTGGVGFFSYAASGTDAALAFFKRLKMY